MPTAGPFGESLLVSTAARAVVAQQRTDVHSPTLADRRASGHTPSPCVGPPLSRPRRGPTSTAGRHASADELDVPAVGEHLGQAVGPTRVGAGLQQVPGHLPTGVLGHVAHDAAPDGGLAQHPDGDRAVTEARRHAGRLVAGGPAIDDHPARSGGFGEDGPEHRPPRLLQRADADEMGADVQTVGRDPVRRPDGTPQRGDNHDWGRGATPRRGRQGCGAERVIENSAVDLERRPAGTPSSRVFCSTSWAIEAPTPSRASASGRALVATRASNT